MNIILPNDAAEFVKSLVAAGEYDSASDAIVDGVRLLMGRKQLRAEIQKGVDELDAGLGIDGEEVFANLHARAHIATDKAG